MALMRAALAQSIEAASKALDKLENYQPKSPTAKKYADEAKTSLREYLSADTKDVTYAIDMLELIGMQLCTQNVDGGNLPLAPQED